VGNEPFLHRAPRILRAALVVGVVLLLVESLLAENPSQVATKRNLLGVVRVLERSSPGTVDHAFALRHGSIEHGRQMTSPAFRLLPTTYYGWGSGLGLAVTQLKRSAPGGLRVAVLGLGVGTSAALFAAEDRVSFYELNPDVIDLAKGEGDYFHYLRDALCRWSIRQGDARALLAEDERTGSPPNDLIVVDVFSGEAIPTHLFTVEAFELYVKRLRPGGVVALHISNRFLDLSPLAFGVGAEVGLRAAVVKGEEQRLELPTLWVLLSTDEAFLDGLNEARPGAIRRSSRRQVVWTDERSSVLEVIE
jgi:hypothetical protein